MARRSAVITIVALLSTLLISTTARAIEFTDQEMKNLAEGKTVRKPLPESSQNGFYGGAGFTLIDAPVDVVWKALSDWKAYPTIFPRTVEATELSRKNNRSLIKIRIGYKVLNIEYHMDVIRNEEGKTITFNLDGNKPHDIDSTKGYWKLMPQADGRTLVAYAVAVKVPAGIVAFLGKSTEEALERNVIGLPKYLKKYVESSAGQRYGRMTAKTP